MLGAAFLGRQRLLVISPHPDDETLGCAGTIARVKALGGQAYVMVVSVGGISQHGRGAGGQGRGFVSGPDRRAELDDVMKFLEVDGYEVLFDDDALHERLDTVPQRTLIEKIEYAVALSLEALRPSMVLFPARSYNQDRMATFRACLAHLDAKIEAMRRYSSQQRPAPFHASVQGAQATAAFHGGQVSIAAAEAFQALRLMW